MNPVVLDAPSTALSEFQELERAYASAQAAVVESAEMHVTARERASDLRERYVAAHSTIRKQMERPVHEAFRETPRREPGENSLAFEERSQAWQREYAETLSDALADLPVRIMPGTLPGHTAQDGLRSRWLVALQRRW